MAVTIKVYDVGDMIRLTGTFYDVDEALSDPTEVTLYLMSPSGAVNANSYVGSPGEVTRDSVGVYYVDFNVTATGMWHYRWEGTGGTVTAEHGQFMVRPRVVT